MTDPITQITPTGVTTADGTNYDVDVIIYATGFDAQEFLESIDITGVGGQKLATQWTDGARAYLGIYVPHFPNLLLSYGPNTNLGGGSIIYMLEAQARHMRQTLDQLRAGGHRRVEVTEAAEEQYDREVQTRLARSVWSQCKQLVPACLRTHHVQLARIDPPLRQAHQDPATGGLLMALNSYPAEPWDLHGHAYIGVWLIPRKHLPPPHSAATRPITIFGRGIVSTAFFVYEQPSPLTYDEIMSTVLVRQGWRPRVSITHIWVNSLASRDGGRGWRAIPKELADFDVAAHRSYVADGIGALDVGRIRRLPFALSDRLSHRTRSRGNAEGVAGTRPHPARSWSWHLDVRQRRSVVVPRRTQAPADPRGPTVQAAVRVTHGLVWTDASRDRLPGRHPAVPAAPPAAIQRPRQPLSQPARPPRPARRPARRAPHRRPPGPDCAAIWQPGKSPARLRLLHR
ncbi:hypothetical protein [Aeromicrobium sp. UC242_57]|uniref:hypothetical protein n=1 Tax=Aeromicrobium sp. UC242_57 TaxID=3374624 RepID=UPI00379042FB